MQGKKTVRGCKMSHMYEARHRGSQSSTGDEVRPPVKGLGLQLDAGILHAQCWWLGLPPAWQLALKHNQSWSCHFVSHGQCLWVLLKMSDGTGAPVLAAHNEYLASILKYNQSLSRHISLYVTMSVCDLDASCDRRLLLQPLTSIQASILICSWKINQPIPGLHVWWPQNPVLYLLGYCWVVGTVKWSPLTLCSGKAAWAGQTTKALGLGVKGMTHPNRTTLLTRSWVERKKEDRSAYSYCIGWCLALCNNTTAVYGESNRWCITNSTPPTTKSTTTKCTYHFLAYSIIVQFL